jgi:NAD-dependent DNA ligase
MQGLEQSKQVSFDRVLFALGIRHVGETVAKTIVGNKTKYQPGNWFNSAKFFDIEYQTYGWAKPQLEKNQSQFYWQHPTKQIAIRLVFETESKLFIGLNVFGWRLRHELLDRYLNEKQSVEYVLSHLNNANFDPEFYRNYVNDIILAYNNQFQSNVQIHKKSWKHILGILK